MKFTAILLLVACLQVSAKGYAQITLSEKNAPLEKVFSAISKQSGYEFLYTTSMLQTARAVDIKVTNATIREVLAICFKDQPFSYTIIEKTVVIKPKPTTVLPPLFPPPPIDVKGRVTNENGEPVEGVSIIIKGTKRGTTTNREGNFSLTVPDGNTILVFSNIGYKTLEIALSNRTTVEVTLQREIQRLNDVVSIGYGSIEKRRLTSTVAVVKADDIKNLPLTSFDQMLQGLASGVFVSNNSGAPGKPTTITIRGRNSINTADPLIIIDGTPIVSQSLGSAFGVDNRLNPLTGINPVDIASIEILKDAGAAAIYGSRAANGVILITTKRGKEGKTSFTIDGYQGVGIPMGKLDLLQTTDYILLRREAFKNDHPGNPLPAELQKPDSLTNTDWQDLVYKPTMIGEYKLSINGGSRQTKFYLSAGYRNETNPLSGKKGLKRGTFRINLDHQPSDRLFIGVSIGGSKDVNQNTADAASSYSAVDAALLAPPNLGPYDSAGNFTVVPMPFGVGNPIAVFQSKINSNTTQIKASLNLRYRIWDGLAFHTDLGFDYNNLAAHIFFPKAVNAVLQNTLFDGSIFNNQTSSYTIEPQLRYEKVFHKDHQVSAIAGSTLQKRTTLASTVYGKGFASDDLQQLSSAAITDGSSSKNQYAFTSLFGRVNYSYLTKYIASATIRRDGSSRFGPGNKFGTFWSVGGGWLFSRESFFRKSKALSLGKLRASYGIVGSDALADFTYIDQFNPISYGGQPGVRPFNAENPNVQWEQTNKLDIGIDLGFFENRLALTVNYFENRTNNLLVTKSLPIQSGISSIQDNLPAEVKNTGYEIELAIVPVQSKQFSWTSKLNLTHEKNILQAFPGIENEAGYKLNYKVGESLNLLWGYRFLGVDPASGTPMYDGYNLDGTKKDPTNPFAGRQIIGRFSPDYYGGFTNNFSYKNWSLDIFIHFVQGLERLNGLSELNNSSSNQSNQEISVLGRWQKPGDQTNIPRSATSSTAWWIGSGVDRQSTRFLEDGSYMRLKNLTISYRLPQPVLSKLKLREVRFFATGQNIGTWTKYKGIDPETGSNVAPVKMFIGGLNITF